MPIDRGRPEGSVGDGGSRLDVRVGDGNSRLEGSVGDGGSRLEGSDGVPVLRGKGREVDDTIEMPRLSLHSLSSSHSSIA